MRIPRGDQNRPIAKLLCIADEEINQRRGIIAQVITGYFDGVAGIMERIVTPKQAGVYLDSTLRERSDRGDAGNSVTENDRRDGDREGVRSS